MESLKLKESKNNNKVTLDGATYLRCWGNIYKNVFLILSL